MGSLISLGQQCDAWWFDETVYGTKVGASHVISDKIYDIRIDSGDIVKGLRGISEPSLCAYISVASDPTIHVEWVIQNTSVSLASLCTTRNALGDLKSCTIEITAYKKGADPGTFSAAGCKCKSFTMTARRGEEIVCSADFSCKSITSGGTMGSPPAAAGTTYGVFNKAGVILTYTGSSGFFITDSFEVTVNNNIVDYWGVGSPTKIAAVPGAIDITGTCDISLDTDAGETHWGEVINNTDITAIVFNTGAGGDYDQITISSVRWTNASIDFNTTDSGMLTSQPFIGKTVAWA